MHFGSRAGFWATILDLMRKFKVAQERISNSVV